MAAKKTKQFEYTVYGGKANLKKCIAKENEKEVVVPASVGDLPVVDLDGKIFENYYNHNTLIISEGIKYIKNAEEIIEKNWSKVVFPKSLEKMDIKYFNEESKTIMTFSFVYNILFVVPENSYAEKRLQELISTNNEYLYLTNNPDISNEEIDEMKSFLCLKHFYYNPNGELEVEPELKYVGKDEKETITFPSSFGRRPIHRLDMSTIPEKTKKVVIPDSIRNIFWTYRKISDQLEEIEISSENTTFSSDGFAIYNNEKKSLFRFYSNKVSDYSVAEGTEMVEAYAFAHMDNLESISLPDSIEEIDNGAFSSCKNLKSVSGLKNVSKVGNNLFDYSENIKSESDYDVEGIVCVGDKVVECSDTSITRLELPEGIKILERGVFEECSSLEYIYIPSTVEEIGDYAISEKSYVEVDPGNNTYCSKDGILLSKDGREAINAPSFSEKTVWELPEGIEVIDKEFALFRDNVTKIVFPKSVKTIKQSAFEEMHSLTEIVFPDDSELEEIGESAFSGCKIERLSLPEGLKPIGINAFAYNNIKKASLPKSIETIDFGAFEESEEVEIYDTIEKNAKDAYKGIDKSNGNPNAKIGWIGLEFRTNLFDYHVWDFAWSNLTITVKSADTDEIKYKVWMGAEYDDWDYIFILSSGWGKNASFAFRQLDKIFPKIVGDEHKLKVAEYRLLYPVDLTNVAKKNYLEYLKKNSDNYEKIIKKIKE